MDFDKNKFITLLVAAKGTMSQKDFAEKCAEVAVLDKAPKLEGRNMTIFLSPKPVVQPKKPAKPKQPKPQAPADEVAE